MWKFNWSSIIYKHSRWSNSEYRSWENRIGKKWADTKFNWFYLRVNPVQWNLKPFNKLELISMLSGEEANQWFFAMRGNEVLGWEASWENGTHIGDAFMKWTMKQLKERERERERDVKGGSKWVKLAVSQLISKRWNIGHMQPLTEVEVAIETERFE